jgi:hypothetical protein
MLPFQFARACEAEPLLGSGFTFHFRHDTYLFMVIIGIILCLKILSV